jgi:hypothetical protein
VESPHLGFFFKPSSGATLFELDYKPANLNVIDSVTRQEEGYHHRIKSAGSDDKTEDGSVSIHDIFKSKEEGLEKLLSYDWYRRGCFTDHFFGDGTDPDRFVAVDYAEEGDFVNQPYKYSHQIVSSDSVVTFGRDGGVWCDGRHARIGIKKEFVVQGSRPEIEVKYRLTNNDEFAVNLHFGIEFNFGFPNLTSHNVNYTIGGDIPARFKRPDKSSSLDEVSEFGLHNGEDNFRLDFLLQKKATLWRMPIYSVSLSEDGFEKVQQGVCLLPSWRIRLDPGEDWNLEMMFRFRELDPKQAERVATVSLARA